MLKRKKIFEDQISEEETDRNIELEQSQMTEYHRLKEVVATKSAKMLNEIHHYDREKNQDQETLNSLNRKRADIERALKGKETEGGFSNFCRIKGRDARLENLGTIKCHRNCV